MYNSESPRTLFELFFTRWLVAPEVVCYDNACTFFRLDIGTRADWSFLSACPGNAHKFCLAREYTFLLICFSSACTVRLSRDASVRCRYSFFKKTKFVIDKLHYHSHKRCSPVYNPYSHVDLDDANTQLAEQFNHALGGVRNQLVQFSWGPWLFIFKFSSTFKQTPDLRSGPQSVAPRLSVILR
jgi:hypothetical protein